MTTPDLERAVLAGEIVAEALVLVFALQRETGALADAAGMMLLLHSTMQR